MRAEHHNYTLTCMHAAHAQAYIKKILIIQINTWQAAIAA